MKRMFAVVLALAVLAVIPAAGAEWAKGMVLGFGEKLTEPQRSIMKVQLGASTQSGKEELGESVLPVTVSLSDEEAPFSGLMKKQDMGPLGVSGAFLRKAAAGEGIWVTASNTDYVPVMYANAFYTAGIRDVIASVSSSEPVPGMMVLAVASGAYEKLTGRALDKKQIKLAAEEILLSERFGTGIGHMEMAAEIMAYAKEKAGLQKGLSKSEIEALIDERLKLYEREAGSAPVGDVAAYIVKYAAEKADHSDMAKQLATIRADQLWLVEPMERMVDEETLAKADVELQEMIEFLDKQKASQSFWQKNSGWLLPVGLVITAAMLSVAIAYFQTRPKRGSKVRK